MISISPLSDWRLLPATAILIAVAGCGGSPPPEKPETPPFQGQSVRLLVVDDPPLAAAVRALQGEWQARSGAELEVAETTAAELNKTADLAADAVIYPSPLLGVLAERRWLAPLPEKFVDHPALAWPDVSLALRVAELHWGSRAVALPLGSRVLLCYYRADLLRQFKKQPPRTWAEYGELARFFAERKNLAKAARPADAAWHGAAEPLAEGWAGLTLLARAAAYARHRDYFSVLFDLNSMAPRIDQPPFVRALNELVETSRSSAAAVLQTTPTEAVDAFLRGECALAIGWPAASAPPAQPNGKSDGSSKPKPIVDAAAMGCMPLPGAVESYDWSAGKFVSVPLRSVPLLACEGRLASLSRAAKQPEAAYQLLAALAGLEWGTRVSSASAATSLFRASQRGEAKRWLAAEQAPSADSYAQAVLESLNTRDVVFALRIPGRERYLAALDGAVREAIAGKATPQETLTRASAQWREITEQLGKDAQRRACENSDVRVVF